MPRKQYWWLVATDDSGEDTLIFGSEISEDDARRQGLTMLPGINFEIKQFPTRDLGTASAMYKGKKLKEGHSLVNAKRHLVHEKGLERKRKREERKHHGSATSFDSY